MPKKKKKENVASERLSEACVSKRVSNTSAPKTSSSIVGISYIIPKYRHPIQEN